MHRRLGALASGWSCQVCKMRAHQSAKGRKNFISHSKGKEAGRDFLKHQNTASGDEVSRG